MLKRLLFLALSLLILAGGGLTAQGVAEIYFQGDTLVELSLSGRAAQATTFTYDAACEQLGIEVTDPDNDPLPASNAYVVRLREADNDQITDLTNRLTVTMRARAAAEVPVQFLFRSEPGSGDFRTAGKEVIIPAGLDAWTEVSVTFDSTDFNTGFDPTQIKDLWFYLDRGTPNFPGNQFFIDHIVVGGPADTLQNSPCMLGDGGGMGTDTMFAAAYFQGDTLIELSLSGTAAGVTTFTLDTLCEQLGMAVTDPNNAPLPGSNAYVVRLRDADNNRVTNLTDRLTVTMRARAAAEVPVQFLFRSEPGSGDFRTAGKEVMIPAGLEEWTEVTVSFDSTNFNSGFDPTQIKDLWFYLDRGTANFPGNQFFVDHIVVGGPADPEQNSPCSLVMGVDGTFVDYFQGDSLTSFTLDNRAGRTANFDFDTVCETLTLSVIDPTNDQLPPFNAFQFNPTNAEGEDITDINGRMNVTMRVRSAEMVNVSVLFRSGGGTMEERTLRKDIDIPGNLEEWTEFTLTFEAADMDGFDPDDLRDVWFYLDRGEPNFAGNFFFIDHIAVGQQPDAAQNSPCNLVVEPQNFVEQFTDSLSTGVLGGVEADRLTLEVTDCEEIRLSVTDTTNAPFGVFRPLIINPITAEGVNITDVTGLTTVFIRARSADPLPLGVLLRSGDGSADFRTATLTQTVAGDLTGWSNLEFAFAGDDLGSFDPEDFVDLWLYLDRENENFPGSELFIDYIALGTKPDSTANSPCGLPDLMTSTREAAWAGGMRIFPNPTGGALTVDIPGLANLPETLSARLLDVTGRQVRPLSTANYAGRFALDLTELPPGTYFLQLIDDAGRGVLRRVMKR